MKKASGVLLPIFSLPGETFIGDLGKSAYAFVDFCKAAGQQYWQILPINPTDGINGHSPYSSPSAFAGNPLFISLQTLVDEGLLTPADLKIPAVKKTAGVDYPQAIAVKSKLLARAFMRFKKNKSPETFDHFITNNGWLNDLALFVTIKQVYNGASWDQWPVGLRMRKPAALKHIEKEYADDIYYIKFVQYIFYKQWVSLKAYANSQGISIIGDIPIYVNFDSADVWCNPQLFQVDTKGHLKFVSGCPPDYFSKTGQRWGNPTYHWGNLKRTKYAWWVKRIRHNLALFDLLRIDHFRGFIGFWQIPAHEKLAVFGRWVSAPGKDFFDALIKVFGKLPIIAEDLGEITPDVIKVMNKFNFPGMRVLLFAFGGDPRKNPHVPANYPVNCVAYTGTHDNNTVNGWYKTESKDFERANMVKVLGSKPNLQALHWSMIDALARSRAMRVIIPVQDLLGLNQEARLNTPATKIDNWSWRLTGKELTPALAVMLKRITVKAGRYEVQ